MYSQNDKKDVSRDSMHCNTCLLLDVLIRTIGVILASSNCQLSRAGSNV